MAEILYKEESYRIVGACMKVHTQLGFGFLESVYQEALEKQFVKDNVPHVREKTLKIQYEGETLKKTFKADFICFEKIIVELKALPFIYNDNLLQLQNYLKSTNMKLGLLVNFGGKSLTYKRVINSRNSL